MAVRESRRGERGRQSVSAARRPRTGSTVALNLVQRLGAVNAKRAAVGAVVLVMLALTLAVPTRTYMAQRAEFSRLQDEHASLTQQVGDYRRRVTKLNDPAYVEQQARERLQYVMPGEKPVVLSYPAREEQAVQEQEAREYAANPWYSNLWDALSTPPEGK